MANQTKVTITLTPEDEVYITSKLRRGTCTERVARRYRIVLMRAQGHSIHHIAEALHISRRHVYVWLYRYLEGGFPAIERPKRRVTVHA